VEGLLFISHGRDTAGQLRGIELVLRGGCRQVQLRMKGAAPAEVEAVARQALALCRAYGGELYIDDHVEVCRRIGARGVHLGKADMPVSEARRQLGGSYVIGGTANTLADIRRLAHDGADYTGLGPFCFTRTKENLSPLLGLAGYRRILSSLTTEGHGKPAIPVVAIGGITLADVPALRAAGIAGVAVSSAILSAPDPVEATAAFCAALRP
jgi:thiamine-phosphate pyrophosphorylase